MISEVLLIGGKLTYFLSFAAIFCAYLTLVCEYPLGWRLCPAAVRSRPASSRRHQPHSSAMS